MNPTQARIYRQNSVQTASPNQLILMLFDGALRFMTTAIQGFEKTELIERNQQIHVNLVRTQAVIDELQGSLNMQVGGDFPKTMFDLYDFMRNQLRTANMRKEAAPVRVVIDLLSDIRNAWATMMVQNENQVPSTQSWVATAA